MVETFLLETTQCPRCQSDLTSKSGQLNCGKCHIRFNEVDGIPWLFAYPEAVLSDWRTRAHFQLQTMLDEVAQMESAAGKAQSQIARERLTNLAVGIKANLRVLSDILKPLATQGKVSVNLLQAVKSQLPLNQKLMGYYANIHRDWCWGEREHKATKDLVDRLMGSKANLGKVLVLGAGAGRFAYEIAQQGAELVVALDINPLLAMFGRRMTTGQAIDFFEFPVAPIGVKQVAVAGKCQAPAGPVKNVFWLMADGMNPPFRAKTFDTIITPWFIDVIPQDLNLMTDQINRLLKVDGQWLNFGPFGFHGNAIGCQYSSEEVLETVNRHGFKVTSSELTDLPYLQSPNSGQRREEKVLGFVAEKTADQPEPKPFRHYPEWLELPSLPVPKEQRLHNYAFATEVQFQALSLIDGSKSMDEIAKAFAVQHGLSSEDALGAVVTLFRQLWDGT